MSDQRKAMANGNDILTWFRTETKVQQEELRLWRTWYPIRARFIAEEARAKVEGRKPNYPPAVAIG